MKIFLSSLISAFLLLGCGKENKTGPSSNLPKFPEEKKDKNAIPHHVKMEKQPLPSLAHHQLHLVSPHMVSEGQLSQRYLRYFLPILTDNKLSKEQSLKLLNFNRDDEIFALDREGKIHHLDYSRTEVGQHMIINFNEKLPGEVIDLVFSPAGWVDCEKKWTNGVDWGCFNQLTELPIISENQIRKCHPDCDAPSVVFDTNKKGTEERRLMSFFNSQVPKRETNEIQLSPNWNHLFIELSFSRDQLIRGTNSREVSVDRSQNILGLDRCRADFDFYDLRSVPLNPSQSLFSSVSLTVDNKKLTKEKYRLTLTHHKLQIYLSKKIIGNVKTVKVHFSQKNGQTIENIQLRNLIERCSSAGNRLRNHIRNRIPEYFSDFRTLTVKKEFLSSLEAEEYLLPMK